VTITSTRRAIEFLMEANALEQVPRTGFALSGVDDPEDVAAHSAGVGVAALLIADRVPEAVDRGRLLTMALLHDLAETRLGDVVIFEKTDEDDRREEEAERAMVEGLPALYGDALREYRAQETVESRIVKAADKLQMMAKVLAYEADDRGALEGFWGNPRNFYDAGLPAARGLFHAICAMRSR
jgi:putative hydrolase of HD superfamily